jgi:hypothetical protein
MSTTETQSRICVVCGAKDHLHYHHIALRGNLQNATVTVCETCHARLGDLLSDYGVRPPDAHGSNPAQVIWALSCGLSLVFSEWAREKIGYRLDEDDAAFLSCIGGLAAALSDDPSRLGPNPIENAARRASRERRTRKQGSRRYGEAHAARVVSPEVEQPKQTAPVIEGDDVLNVTRELTGALAAIASELFEGSEQDAELVRWLGELAARPDVLVRSLSHLESHPRLGELERMRRDDLGRFCAMPRALRRIRVAETVGEDPDPADLELLARDAAAMRRAHKLSLGLAGSSGQRETHILIDRHLREAQYDRR